MNAAIKLAQNPETSAPELQNLIVLQFQINFEMLVQVIPSTVGH